MITRRKITCGIATYRPGLTVAQSLHHSLHSSVAGVLVVGGGVQLRVREVGFDVLATEEVHVATILHKRALDLGIRNLGNGVLEVVGTSHLILTEGVEKLHLVESMDVDGGCHTRTQKTE